MLLIAASLLIEAGTSAQADVPNAFENPIPPAVGENYNPEPDWVDQMVTAQKATATPVYVRACFHEHIGEYPPDNHFKVIFELTVKDPTVPGGYRGENIEGIAIEYERNGPPPKITQDDTIAYFGGPNDPMLRQYDPHCVVLKGENLPEWMRELPDLEIWNAGCIRENGEIECDLGGISFYLLEHGTPTATGQATATETETTMPTSTKTGTSTPTETGTPIPTETDTPSPTITITISPTATPSPTETATQPPTPENTATPSATATDTQEPTATQTETATPSSTPTATGYGIRLPLILLGS